MSNVFIIVLYFVLSISLLLLFALIYIALGGRLRTILLPLCYGIIIRKKYINEDLRGKNLSQREQQRENTRTTKVRKCGFYLKNTKRILYQVNNNEIKKGILKKKTQLTKNSSCSICLEDFCSNEEILRLGCSHGYHENCIFDLVKSRLSNEETFECPLCKRSIRFKDFGNVGNFQDTLETAINSQNYGSIGEPFGRLGITFV